MSVGMRGNAFFNSAAVLRDVGRRKRRALSKQGAFVRRAARSSMRRRKKPSPPGKPPSVHSSEPNLRTIYFVWESQNETVLVGAPDFRNPATSDPAPGLHEKGGKTTLRRGRYTRSRKRV